MQADYGSKNRAGQSARCSGKVSYILANMHDYPDEFQNTYRKLPIIFWGIH
jgi:hypothetical protein